MFKGCYVYFDPNGGVWPDGSTDPKLSPTPNGILDEKDDLYWPDGADLIKRDGYRPHSSISYFNILRFYSADGKGGGINVSKDYNNFFGYDYWPYNSEELSNHGHDANYFSKEGLDLKDGDTCTLYVCWDPLVKYHINDDIIQDFVYKTGGDEYTFLKPGDDTRYAQNKSSDSICGYKGKIQIPSDLNVKEWVDADGNVYTPGGTYTITKPLDLFVNVK